MNDIKSYLREVGKRSLVNNPLSCLSRNLSVYIMSESGAKAKLSCITPILAGVVRVMLPLWVKLDELHLIQKQGSQFFPIYRCTLLPNTCQMPVSSPLVFIFRYVNGLIDFNFDSKRKYDILSYK